VFRNQAEACVLRSKTYNKTVQIRTTGGVVRVISFPDSPEIVILESGGIFELNVGL
jgi:hypothetical protein